MKHFTLLILNAEALLLQKHICFDLNQFPSQSQNWLGNKRIYFSLSPSPCSIILEALHFFSRLFESGQAFLEANLSVCD